MMIVWDSSLQDLVYLPEMTLRISHANNGLISVAMKNHSQKLRPCPIALNPTNTAKMNHNKIIGMVIERPMLGNYLLG